MYETELFWEDKPSDLENNWAIAKRRFGNLSIKCKTIIGFIMNTKNIVKDQIKENIVEECSSHFETNSYYMPHSAVVRKDKETTKVRMVFDASSKDELIRVGGRLQKSNFSYLQKHPIILPAKHYFVNLMVRDSHEKVFHGGVSETLLEIREQFWLIKGRQTVKNILKKCLICKRFSSTSGVQVTAPLPALRVEQSVPFSVVGIDFGGPLYTKDKN
ncbi:integrase catalytic domain-containing protein [Trichonephila clavipes]|nr:integrase catalytic domain-containing protein [Trichonephila clavipes]